MNDKLFVDDKLPEEHKSSSVIAVDISPKFWALLPCVNINFHTREVEFEWLCFGVYFRWWRL